MSRVMEVKSPAYTITQKEARLVAWSLRQCHQKIRELEYWMANLELPGEPVFNDALELAQRLEAFAKEKK